MSLNSKRIVFFSLAFSYLVFTVYVYCGGTLTANKISDEASSGRTIFREKNCISCHQIYGLGGYMGPDLTNVISFKGVDYVRAYIQNGSDKMPNFKLTHLEIESLISYLSWIDLTSDYPANKYKINWVGTVQIDNSKK